MIVGLLGDLILIDVELLGRIMIVLLRWNGMFLDMGLIELLNSDWILMLMCVMVFVGGICYWVLFGMIVIVGCWVIDYFGGEVMWFVMCSLNGYVVGCSIFCVVYCVRNFFMCCCMILMNLLVGVVCMLSGVLVSGVLVSMLWLDVVVIGVFIEMEYRLGVNMSRGSGLSGVVLIFVVEI